MAERPESSTSDMTFFEHIDALRPHLVRGAAALFIVMIAAFCLREFVIDEVLFGPQSPGFPTNRLMAYLAHLVGNPALEINPQPLNMINTTMAGQFNLHLKISFWAAIIIAVPYLLWEMWRFIKPALTPQERQGTNRAVFYVSLCFLIGVMFGYFLIVPLAVNFLGNYHASEYISNMIDAGSYLSTVMSVSLGCGMIFLLPLLVWVLAKIGMLTSAFMRKNRRYAIIILAAICAIITPPDILSMVLVLLPMLCLYEFSITIAARVERQRAQAEAQGL